jgi:hypothetical protein
MELVQQDRLPDAVQVLVGIGESGPHRRALDDLRIGEDVAPVPGLRPGGQEVEARQVPLQAVHIDVEAAFGRRVGERDELLDGAGPDQGAVGLEVGPQREDPDVVQAQCGDRVEVGTYGVQAEVEPVVEPNTTSGIAEA